MSVLSDDAVAARGALERLTKGSMVATARKRLPVHHYSLNLLIRTGLVEVDERPARVVVRITTAGRAEVASWR